MEQFTNNVASQAATQEQMNITAIQEQLLEANRKIEELESELAWSSRAYE